MCFSIDQMSEVMRHAVESGTKIREELILEQQEFIVDEVRCLYGIVDCIRFSL